MCPNPVLGGMEPESSAGRPTPRTTISLSRAARTKLKAVSEEKDVVEVPREQLQAWIDEIRSLRAAAEKGTSD